ncbi:MAG TPA: hypothetical protein VFM18_22195 [Methanosarcina sp.]|nr:hypothetical protein [Methanosarcina sp.]
MTYRQLDQNNDYTFGSGLSNFYINTPEAVAQAVQTRLKLWEGEWFLDIVEGTPYLAGILGKYTQDTIDQLIQKRILETQGVTSIISYEGSYNGDLRSYTITVLIDTEFGQANIYGAF